MGLGGHRRFDYSPITLAERSLALYTLYCKCTLIHSQSPNSERIYAYIGFFLQEISYREKREILKPVRNGSFPDG
jgi:hypothetical protein